MTKPITATIAVLIAVGGLVGIGTVSKAGAANSPGRPITWIAAGDSYSSGEGLPHSVGPCAQASGGDSVAYAQAAYNLLQSSGQVQLAAPLGFVACSGARTSEFFAPQGSNPAQWTGGRADLITFTFGGDDIDFSDVIEQCIGLVGRADSNYVTPDPGSHFCPADATMRQRIQNDLTDKYQEFLTRVANQAVTHGGNIVVLGYPELIEDPKLWTGLPQFFDLCQGITRADAEEIRGLAGDLNATIGWDVEKVNARHPNGVSLTFIDVNSGGSHGISTSDSRLFEPSNGQRHNLCSAHSWINGISAIGHFGGSFHPKQAGQNAEGSLLAQIISTRLTWNLPPPSQPALSPSTPNPSPPAQSQGPATPPSQPALAPSTPNPSPPAQSQGPETPPVSSSSSNPQPYTYFNNYGPATQGVPMCRGNPERPESMPGGTVTQTFTANTSGMIDTAKVQIDPDNTVTATAVLNINGTDMASASQPASGDVVFNFSPVSVTAGSTVNLRISFTATYGKIITIYEAGNPGGSLSVTNSCSDGAPTFTRTDTGLRAVISGTA